jgi:SAM-dependent methyltransferase
VEPAAYAEHEAYERWHWWFAGRRAVMRSLLDPLDARGRWRVLAIGCGYGAEMDYLATYGRTIGTEVEGAPLRSSHSGGKRSVAMAMGEALPFTAQSFDLVGMLDVLEHIAGDCQALEEAHRVLNPGGYLLLTVPALPWLWSEWDVRAHHRRRYTRRSLTSVLDRAGFRLCRVTFFNSALLPVVAAVRLIKSLGWVVRPADGDEFALGSWPLVNRLLTHALKLEALWIRRASLPVGVSLAALARREW